MNKEWQVSKPGYKWTRGPYFVFRNTDEKDDRSDTGFVCEYLQTDGSVSLSCVNGWFEDYANIGDALKKYESMSSGLITYTYKDSDDEWRIVLTPENSLSTDRRCRWWSYSLRKGCGSCMFVEIFSGRTIAGEGGPSIETIFSSVKCDMDILIQKITKRGLERS